MPHHSPIVREDGVLIDPLGSRPRLDPARTAELKGWARQALALSEDTTIMVTELRCTEPGCPPFETVFAVMDKPGAPRQYKVFKPITEVTENDVRTLPASPAKEHA
jgi:hypothetical protein